MTGPTHPRIEFLGVRLDLLDLRDTVAAIESNLDEGRAIAHLGVNAANLILARDHPSYREDLLAADLVSPDGQSVVWGARMFGFDVPERVTGIDLMEALLGRARERDWSVYLLGARPEVVSALARRLERDGVRVAGYRDGYFSDEAVVEVVSQVRESGADLLFVGLPSPQKEHLIIHHARPAAIGVAMGVGGSFDVLSGQLKRAPGIVQRLGLEWLFRLLQEPRRLLARYAVTNTRYLLLLVAEASRRRRRHGR